MQLPIYQIDAFTSRVFGGNPAAVIPLQSWLDDRVLQQIAEENNLSETAFVVGDHGSYDIRWFTPKCEVDLCGHATLAAAHYLYHHRGLVDASITFRSRGGPLEVRKETSGYEMNFPRDLPLPTNGEMIQTIVDQEMIEGCFKGKDDFLVILRQADQVRTFVPNLGLIARLDGRGLIVSAPGDSCDFVSRCFFPAYGIPEDPVTGSAHTLLAPYWSKRKGKDLLIAQQLSTRGGEIRCRLIDDRVLMTGQAVTYMTGQISIP